MFLMIFISKKVFAFKALFISVFNLFPTKKKVNIKSIMSDFYIYKKAIGLVSNPCVNQSSYLHTLTVHSSYLQPG